MRENRTSGTVWGVPGNRHSYHDDFLPKLQLELNSISLNITNTILKKFRLSIPWFHQNRKKKLSLSELGI